MLLDVSAPTFGAKGLSCVWEVCRAGIGGCSSGPDLPRVMCVPQSGPWKKPGAGPKLQTKKPEPTPLYGWCHSRHSPRVPAQSGCVDASGNRYCKSCFRKKCQKEAAEKLARRQQDALAHVYTRAHTHTHTYGRRLFVPSHLWKRPLS